MLRVAQWFYDFWYDLTGVLVGSYRRWFYLVTLIAFRMVYDVCHGWYLFIPLEIPVSWILWFTLTESRERARIDDEYHQDGKYSTVNRRALLSQYGLKIAVVIDVSVCLMFSLVVGFFECGVYALVLVSLSFNECLLVRERNTQRFKIGVPNVVRPVMP